MLAASVLQVTDLFAVGIGFDIAGAYLLARGLLISPHGLWVRFTIAGAGTRFVDEAKDRVMAVVGLGTLASGFVIKAFGYALSLAVEPPNEVVRHGNQLLGHAERELGRAQVERLAGHELDDLGQVGRVLAEVDVRDVVVPEHANLVAQSQVDAGGLDGVLPQRLDADATPVKLFAHRAVAQYHGAP